MHPILFHVGPVTFYTYGVLVALAFVVGTLWTLKRAQAAGEDPDTYLEGVFWILVAGFVGARLLYVVYFPDLYLHHPLRIVLDRGGLVWYGGLVGAMLATLVFVKWRRVSLPRLGDIVLPPAALGLAVGRIGCLMSGCCYGRPTHLPWGIQFPPGHETYPMWVHPTQLYESFSLVALTLILAWLYRRVKTPGVVMSLFFIGYGLIRFVIEFYRGDVVYWVGHSLTASQVFSLVGIVGGLICLAVFKKQAVHVTILE